MAGGVWKRWWAFVLVGSAFALGCGSGSQTGGAPGAQVPVPGPDGESSSVGPGEPPPAKPGRCTPTAGEPRWLLEGETLSAQITCKTGWADPSLRFSVSPLPAGASLDAATGALTWVPSSNQDLVWELTLREDSTGETGSWKVGVATAIGSSRRVAIEEPARYTEEYGLPVFHFTTPAKLSSGTYSPAQLVYRGQSLPLELKYRGATSSVFPKRSFTVKFPDEQPFNEPVFGEGFQGVKRLVLITTFNDNSYVRSRLAFDLWNRMAEDHIRIRTFNAVVYLNDRYLGLYTVADHVDDRLMRRHGLVKDGALFKADTADANFSRTRASGEAKASLSEGYELKEGPNTLAPIEELTAFVADSDSATFRAQRTERLHASDYEDWWIFNSLILGTDSAGKNAYHFYNPFTRGPWRYIPWDLDASLGQNFDTTRTSATLRHPFTSQNQLFARMLGEPSIAGPMRERYRALLRNELSLETVIGLIDRYEAENGAAARRDWSQWGDAYLAFGRTYDTGNGNFPSWGQRTDFNTYEQELAYLRSWIRTRWQSLLSSGVP